MVINNNKHYNFGIIFLLSFTGLIIFLVQNQVNAQEMPPRPVAVSLIQNLSFGGLTQGLTTGTITITAPGMRYATGSVILVGLGILYYPAICGLQGNPGTIMHPYGPDATLTGSNGGSITFHFHDSSPTDPIIINVAPPGTMQVRVGGTLDIGYPAANPPGHYTGSFQVMFIQE